MLISLWCFLLTMLVYKSQQRNRLFIYCMDMIPSCQLLLDWTVSSSSGSGSSSISLIWILIRQKWLLNFLKPGSWQGTILRKHNSARRSTNDCRTRLPRFKVGDRVFIYMPAAKACKAYKFARPFYGPYRIVDYRQDKY